MNMSDAHANQMMLLLGFVGLLLFVIVAVIAQSQRKNKKSKTDTEVLPTEKVHELLKSIPDSDIKEIVEVPADFAFTNKEPAALAQVDSAPADLKKALKKTEASFFGRIRQAFSNSDKAKVLDEIEEILYTSDLGPLTVQKLLAVVEKELSSKELKDLESVKSALKKEMLHILQPLHNFDVDSLKLSEHIQKIEPKIESPIVLMIVGVNGAGKTTSIGKLTAQLASQNKKVLVAAGDTFRAAAGGQLKEWMIRAQDQVQSQAKAQAESVTSHAQAVGGVPSTGHVEIFWPENVTDPSAVAFDAVSKAKAQSFDYLIIDTAGRLHTQSHLMDELKKVKRVMAKVIPEAPHQTWIVLDANSGQNALMQAKEFHQALGLSGIILTKMDGTAKGGVALGVVDQLGLPIKLIGVGEKINDLQIFNYSEYVDSILGY